MSSSDRRPEALKDATFSSALELATGPLFGRSKSSNFCMLLLLMCHSCRISQNVTTNLIHSASRQERTNVLAHLTCLHGSEVAAVETPGVVRACHPYCARRDHMPSERPM